MALAFTNPSWDPWITVSCSYMYVRRELSKRVLLQTFVALGLYAMKPASRKTMVSDEVFYRHARHTDEECFLTYLAYKPTAMERKAS